MAVRLMLGFALASLLLRAGAAQDTRAFERPADTPAMSSRLAARSPLTAVTTAGQRIVAVGLRGHVVYSDDLGKSWVQGKVPVSTDLVAVTFVGGREGWAVGHGGVVIHSSDGGASWDKQVDGDRLSRIAVAHYESLVGAGPDAKVSTALERAKAVATDGSTKALLDVVFMNDKVGFVVGAFNRIFRTADGGNSWVPWMEKTGNDHELHFYSARASGGHLLLTGEQGMVWDLDPGTGAVEAKPTPYKGTLFGSLVSGPDILVFGMRGSVFRSADEGRSWTKVAIPEQAGITGGTVIDGKRMVLATQAGKLLVSDDAGTSFRSVAPTHTMSYYGISAAPGGRVALVGSEGVQVEALP
jgi:photosystem II stability/assembly factor-like uncharacterized protein